MNVHAFVANYIYHPTQILVGVAFYKASDDSLQIALYLTISSSGVNTAEDKKAVVKTAIETYATNQGWTLDSIGFDHPDSPAYVSGVKKYHTFDFLSSASVSSGVAAFNLTDDGTSSGNAVFSEVFSDSPRFLIDDNNDVWSYSGVTVSGDKKTLFVTVRRLALSLGVLVWNNAPDGTVVQLTVKGK